MDSVIRKSRPAESSHVPARRAECASHGWVELTMEVEFLPSTVTAQLEMFYPIISELKIFIGINQLSQIHPSLKLKHMPLI
jgi:hypothetical protein